MKHIYAFITIIYIIFLMVMAVIPNLNDIDQVRSNDKVFHFIAFFILTILMYQTILSCQINYGILVTALLVFAFSFLNENIQKFVNGRTFNPADMTANAIGIVLGIIIIVLFRKS